MPDTSTRHSRTGPPPPTTRGAAREEAILSAAVELLTELGYDRITVDQIAARAGASKATMYRRWPGKAPLIGEALRRHSESGPPHQTDTGSLRGDLLAAVKGMTRSITGQDGPALLGLVDAVRDHDDLRAIVEQQIQSGCDRNAAAIVRHATERGEMSSTPDNAAQVLGLAVAQLLFTTLMTGSPPTSRAQAHLVDKVLIPLIHAGSPAGSVSTG